MVAFLKIIGIIKIGYGSLAQLGEHYLDKVGVAGSSPARSIFKFLIPSMNYLTLI